MSSAHTVMSSAALWATIACMAAVTFGHRIFFIAVFGRREVPVMLRRALRFVPAAVLSALVMPDLLYNGAALDCALGNHRLIAGVIAGLAAWRTKNVAVTVVVGMAALILLDAIR